MGAIVLSGCSSLERSELLPTLSSTALPTSTLSSTLTPIPAAQPPANQALPTAMVEPTPTPCQYSLQPDLADVWSRLVLGCPITPGATSVSTAYAPFEGGQMLWRGDTDVIYVLYPDGRWASYPNEWRAVDPEFTCGDENPLATPIRGFGRVWCDHPDVQEVLGALTAAEIGDSGSVIQDFVNGTILVAPFGGVFIFEGEDRTWRRVEE